LSAAEATRALQAVLAGEHAAVFAYGALAARLTGAQRDAAITALESHRARRDEVTERVRALGEEPAAAAPAYRLPGRLAHAKDARRLAADVEDRVADLYGQLVAAADGRLRVAAARALADAAVRAATWRGRTSALPGLTAASPT
jgi:uncharacterized protein DUF4439